MKLVRRTGAPPHPEDLKAYEQDFMAGFDKAQLEAKKDMDLMQSLLKNLDKELAIKYPVEGDVDMPKTQKAWQELIDTYGAPVLIAKSADDPKELVLVIMDVAL